MIHRKLAIIMIIIIASGLATFAYAHNTLTITGSVSDAVPIKDVIS